jgi:hypothetical protein
MLWLKGLLVDKQSSTEVDTSITDRDDQIAVLAQLSIHCNPVLESFQRYAIDLLQDVDDAEREIYTDLYAKVFSSANVSSHNPVLMQMNQPLFDALLVRFRDKSPKIRLIMATAAGTILVRQMHHQANKEQLQNLIVDTSLDRDEAVRVAIIESVHTAGLAEAEAITSRIVTAIVSRCADRKVRRRHECGGDVGAR